MLIQNSRVARQTVVRCSRKVWILAVALAAVFVYLSHDAALACGQVAKPGVRERTAPWAPKLYAFDMEASDSQRRSLAKEAQMLHELGFDGVAYLLWLDDDNTKLRMFGEDFDENLKTLDEVGLPLLGLGAVVSVDPNTRSYDPRLVDVIRKVKGRPLTIEVMLEGLPPGDGRGLQPAIKTLRELGDLAAKSGVRISVYHHLNSWAQNFDDALRVAKKTNHANVGVNFNVAHWLNVDGDKDYRARLRDAGDKVFVVTINGAKIGATTMSELVQPLDRGDFDNRQLLEMLRKTGYQGSIGLQCFGIPGDARDHLQRSIDVWKAWEAEWADEAEQ